MEDWSFIDPKKAFDEALEKGILSDNKILKYLFWGFIWIKRIVDLFR